MRVVALSVALLVTGSWCVAIAVRAAKAKAALWRLVPLCIVLMLVLHLTGVVPGAGAWLQQSWQRPRHEAIAGQMIESPSDAVSDNRFDEAPIAREAFRIQDQWLMLSDRDEERYAASTELSLSLATSLERDRTEPFHESGTIRAGNGPAPISTSSFWAVWWWGMLWATGTVGCWMLAALGSLRYRWVIHRSMRRVCDAVLLERLRLVQQRLGMRRQVRVFEHTSLVSPIAYGVWQPTIVLPSHFAERFDRYQQEAVFAHELAHLMACDTGWRQLSDFICSLLWWHPFVWFAQARLRDSMELAADEACLRIPEGPDHLAACLVRVGRELVGPAPGVVAISGPRRSSLARRVQRLMELSKRNASPLPRTRRYVTLLLVLLVFSISTLVPAAVLGADSYSQLGGNPMQMLRNSWRRSLVGVAMAAWMTPVLLADGEANETESNVEVEVEVVADVTDDDGESVERYTVDETETKGDGKKVIVRQYRVRGGDGRASIFGGKGEADGESVVEQRIVRHRARLAEGESPRRPSELSSSLRSVEPARRSTARPRRDRSALIREAIENLRAAGLDELAEQASKRLSDDGPSESQRRRVTTSRFGAMASESGRSNVDNLQRQLEVMRRQMQSMQRTLNQLMEQRRSPRDRRDVSDF